MKVLIHDLQPSHGLWSEHYDQVICADGKYAPCQGCFGCWTRHPGQCFMKDKLQKISQILGNATELTIVTENYYGCYSPAVKNILDRNLGAATPLCTYRAWQMHHVSRYPRGKLMRVLVYGDISDQEKETFQYLLERNQINENFEESEIHFVSRESQLEELL